MLKGTKIFCVISYGGSGSRSAETSQKESARKPGGLWEGATYSQHSSQTSSMRWRSILAARTPISRSKFQKKAKETIAGRKNKQTLIETVIENWLVCLFVTRARQLGSDSLKARHVIIATFAYAQTSDHCTRLTRVTTVEQENRLNVVRFTNLK